jgi:DNA gyrase inhibitor GyrI
VGQPTEQDNNGQNTTVVPITIALDDPAAADGIQRANVTVDVPSETRDNVLSVPIEALMALPGGDFGIEVVRADGSTDRLAVTTGLFAGGLVEISGDGVEAGLDVMVPER